MTAKEQAQYALSKHVSALTPPVFLLHAYDDSLVPIEESLLYAEAMYKNDRPVEIHLFANGEHGFGSGRVDDGTAQWLGLLANWIKRQ